jgi:uncharacterized circularly permuted ATP-grasp superfamily protein/uncharacterized alpha-E superfamily protein
MEAWLSSYKAKLPADCYDELLESPGVPRAAWRKLCQSLESLGLGEIRRRWDQAKLLLRDHGVSYDAYGDPQGVTRPWNLSPIPVVVGSDEWSNVAKGLAQRARLLEEVLTDIYGPQRLLLRGELPPEIVFAHPGFLRACVGIKPPSGHHLPLYAADLVRTPDGRLSVLVDRTRAPSGAGYALENRIVLSRSLPEVFGECNVERLALFFRTMRDSLRQLAPHNRDNPRIALLTPGPYNATYFEQAFLAQYLGFTLVQGSDLTVRDHRVYLKTLSGLQPIDVILRRVNDDLCDPLELRPDTGFGVPGLVEATRSGNVALANPLGSGLLQAPAFMPFLPALCRALLGEELILPSVKSYWCGDPTSLAYVDAHLTELVIKPIYSTGPTGPIFARDLPAAALADLKARVHADPRMFVAQDAVVLSTVPTLAGDDLAPAHLWMRTYAVASSDDFEIMPGALSRVGGPDERFGLSLRPGGESKDTWVLSGGPVNEFSLLQSIDTPAQLSRGGGDLPSRVADNLFWLGRYAERTEGTARLARAIAARLSDQQSLGDPELGGELEALLRVLQERTEAQAQLPVFEPADSKSWFSWMAAAERYLRASVFDAEPSGTLRATAADATRVGRAARDRVSNDTFRTIARVDQEIRDSALASTRANTLGALMRLLDRTITALAAFSGLAMDSMTRGQAWRFLDMGRRLERGVHVLSLVHGAFAVPCKQESALLEAMLEVADSSMTYRRRYLATLQVAPVVDLLLTDETNPRSVAFQIAALADHVDALPREPGMPTTPLQKLVITALAQLRLADITQVCEANEQRARPSLLEMLERLSKVLPELSNALSEAYLSHAAVSRQLSSGAWL